MKARMPMTAARNEPYSRAANQISVDLDGDIAILNLGSKTYFGLTDVGAFIWEQLENPKRFQDLLAAISAEFAVDEGRCAADLENFLAAMVKAGLVETAPADA